MLCWLLSCFSIDRCVCKLACEVGKGFGDFMRMIGGYVVASSTAEQEHVTTVHHSFVLGISRGKNHGACKLSAQTLHAKQRFPQRGMRFVSSTSVTCMTVTHQHASTNTSSIASCATYSCQSINYLDCLSASRSEIMEHNVPGQDFAQGQPSVDFAPDGGRIVLMIWACIYRSRFMARGLWV